MLAHGRQVFHLVLPTSLLGAVVGPVLGPPPLPCSPTLANGRRGASKSNSSRDPASYRAAGATPRAAHVVPRLAPQQASGASRGGPGRPHPWYPLPCATSFSPPTPPAERGLGFVVRAKGTPSQEAMGDISARRPQGRWPPPCSLRCKSCLGLSCPLEGPMWLFYVFQP